MRKKYIPTGDDIKKFIIKNIGLMTLVNVVSRWAYNKAEPLSLTLYNSKVGLFVLPTENGFENCCKECQKVVTFDVYQNKESISEAMQLIVSGIGTYMVQEYDTYMRFLEMVFLDNDLDDEEEEEEEEENVKEEVAV